MVHSLTGAGVPGSGSLDDATVAIGLQQIVTPSATPASGAASAAAGGAAGAEAAAPRASAVGSPTEGVATSAAPAGGGQVDREPWLPPLNELPHGAFQFAIEFSVDDATGRTIARVVDRETGEVVRQVPPEYVLQVAMYIEALLGRVLDARA